MNISATPHARPAPPVSRIDTGHSRPAKRNFHAAKLIFRTAKIIFQAAKLTFHGEKAIFRADIAPSRPDARRARPAKPTIYVRIRLKDGNVAVSNGLQLTLTA